MDFEQIVVETDRLNFPALAAGTGPPVVCWHGFPDHPLTFEPLAERLVAAGRRVVAPFLRGLHEDTVEETTYVDGLTLAADAAAVASALAAGRSEGIDMVGHDIGAGMVQRVAAAWPERVRRAVTLAIPPPWTFAEGFGDPVQQQRLFYLWLFQIEGIAEAILENDRRLIDHLWETWSPGLSDMGEHRERVHKMYGDPRFIRSTLRIYRANFDRGLHDPMLADLAQRTEVPSDKAILLLGGADDGCLDPKLMLAARPDLAVGSRVDILENAGHFLHLERPAAVAELVLDWLGDR